MNLLIREISNIVDRRPFVSLAATLIILNLLKIGGNPNYVSLVSILGVFISAVTSVALKFLFRKNRPTYKRHRVIKYGFPSSHTQIAFAITTVYSYYAPSTTIFLFLAASFIAASRILTNAHKEKDVIGGILLGVLTGMFSVWIAANWAPIKF